MKPIHLALVALAASMIAWGASAGEPPRFPLIWQARSEPNANGASVTRLHDPEAGVNCYVISGAMAAELDGKYTSSTSLVGHIGATAISCVKVH